MTTTRAPRVTSPNRMRRRLLHTWRTLFAPGDLTALVLVLAMLMMPALALNAADWPLSMRIILPVTVLSVVIGFILARSQYNELLALLLGTLYGGCAILIMATVVVPGGAEAVVSRSVTWIMDAVSGGINQDDLIFTLLVATLFWFLGYNAVWHIFRIDRVWRVILPPGFIFVVNSVFYTGNNNLDLYIGVYIFIALLLIVRSSLEAREWDWYANGIRVPRQMRRQFLQIGAVLSLTALLVAWAVPSRDLQDRLDNFQKFLQSDPITQIAETLNRLFSPIDAEGPATADYYGGDSLNLGGAIRLGDQIVMLVNAPQTHRYYWRSRVFDHYNGGTWVPGATYRVPDTTPPLDINLGTEIAGRARDPVQQHFTVGLSASRLIYTAPQPLNVSLPGRIDLSYTDAAETVMNVSVIRPLQVLYRGDTYDATSLVSVATATQLREAGAEYPQWISDTYLDVPESITARTRELAAEIVRQASAITPYDQAKAIEHWLRVNIAYSEAIPAPPSNRDPVDWILFDERQGYCVYYASAMIVMLRSQGIPARMAAGFAQGEYDAQSGQYIVRERDAHTWVEAYFPGYGWIEFEPTAAQEPLNREGDTEQPGVAPSAPQASPTPIPTATPLPTPTPLPSVPPQQQDLIMPTVTPTSTPTPTVTPVIVPTFPPPIEPQPQSGFLSFLLGALGLALLGLLTIGLLVALAAFIWWWWEWRGLKGLSPVARAYARLERYIPLVGIHTGQHHTPIEKRQIIVRNLPAAERPVTAITRMYTVERYGPEHQGDSDERNTRAAERAWPEARRTILRRWLRRFIPWKR